MASFIARVELHGGTADDYGTLNQAMADFGFSRVVQADNGATVELPSGQYLGIGEFTAPQISELSQQAALKTKKGFAVFVTDFTTAAWFGLDAAEAPGPRS